MRKEKTMQEIWTKFLKVKTLVTLMLTAVFCAETIRGHVTGEQFLVIFTTVIAFYFGTQAEKKEG